MPKTMSSCMYSPACCCSAAAVAPVATAMTATANPTAAAAIAPAARRPSVPCVTPSSLHFAQYSRMPYYPRPARTGQGFAPAALAATRRRHRRHHRPSCSGRRDGRAGPGRCRARGPPRRKSGRCRCHPTVPRRAGRVRQAAMRSSGWAALPAGAPARQAERTGFDRGVSPRSATPRTASRSPGGSVPR